MFKENTSHLQTSLFSFYNSLSLKMQNELLESEEYKFYELVYCKISEKIFSHLYSNVKSRPNSPINAMVSAIILMNRKEWTFETLFDNIKFNLLTKIALGLKQIDEIPFSEATLYNFLVRLNRHYEKTGESLIDVVHKEITEEQLKRLNINTEIQRTDSFLAASNIRNYTRLQLLVETIKRVYRILSDQDKERFDHIFEPYIKNTSVQFIYKIKKKDIKDKLKEAAKTYLKIEKYVRPLYCNNKIFEIFERLFNEHFTVTKEEIELKETKELTSNSLQSPDDPDATFTTKYNKESRGQKINIVETADPDNEINLITDVAVAANNQDDSKILNDRLEEIKEKTPGINEIHTDGAYGSKENDKKCKELGIKHIQTAVRGQEARVNIKIEQLGDSQYELSCPNQTVKSEAGKKRYKAVFDLGICSDCLFRDECSTNKNKKARTYYFKEEDYLKKKRQDNIQTIPKERRTIRNNVEASVYEFKRKMPNGKLKTRGKFKTILFAMSMAISINFGRIVRCSSNSTDNNPMFVEKSVKNHSILLKNELFQNIRISLFKMMKSVAIRYILHGQSVSNIRPNSLCF